MHLKIIGTLNHLRVSDIPVPYFIKSYILSNNHDFVEREFFTPDFIQQTGFIDLNKIISGYYFYINAEKVDIVSTDKQLTEISMEFLQNIMGFTFFLWFIKDNSVHPETVYVYDLDRISMKRLNTCLYSNCYGLYQDCTFKTSELEQAVVFLEKYSEITNQEIKLNDPDYAVKFNSPQESGFNFQNYNAGTRIDRAINFLQMARAQSFLPAKISMCIPIYESLFSFESSEITHRICERVAFYLGDSKEERLAIYDSIKRAYDFRSRFFHGDELDKKSNVRENQKNIAKEIDDITRRVLTKIILHDSEIFMKSKDDLRNWFKDLIFK